MPLQFADLPMMATPNMAAEVLGLTKGQMRELIHSKKIATVPIGKRALIPRDAIAQFVSSNTVPPCHAETQVQGYAFSTNVNASTLSGQKGVAAGSAARALQIASKLKSPSPTSCTQGHGQQGRVIPLRSS